MAFCASCGSSAQGRFCATCGSPVAAPAASGSTTSGTAPMPDNVASAFTYIFPINIVFLRLAPYDRNPAVRFHALQSLFLDLACIALWLGLDIVTGILRGVVGTLVLSPVYWLIQLTLLGGWLYLIVHVFQGKNIVLPVIGPLAQQQSRF